LAKVPGLVTEEVEQYETLGDVFPRTSNMQLHVLIVAPPHPAAKRAGEELVSQPSKKVNADVLAGQAAADTSFWAFITATKPEIAEGSLTKLPDDVQLIGGRPGLQIFIRFCYPQLLQHVLELTENKEKPNVVILGNPGIGKSYFGYLLVWYLVNQGITVVYENRSSLDVCVLITPDSVERGSTESFHPYLGLSTTFYIVDGVTPRSVLAKTILITSPKREIWYPFRKQQNPSVVHMPVWTWEEIMACRVLVYPSVPADAVEDCFDRWGGIARYVLERAQDPSEQKQIDDAIRQVDLDYLVRAVGDSQVCDQLISHRVLHMEVNELFTAVRYVFGSEYIEKKVMEKFVQDSKEKLIHFLATSTNASPLGSLRGTLFEGYAHRVLAQGGNFRVRLLKGEADAEEKGDEETMVLPTAKTVVFKKNSDIHEQESVYYRPDKKNYPAVDAFEYPDLLFQFTVAETHPCKQGLYDVLRAMAGGDKKKIAAQPNLYFVVPPDRFKTFQSQNYTDANGRKVGKAKFKSVQAIRQYALEIKLSGAA
jgi:hypothetical protein